MTSRRFMGDAPVPVGRSTPMPVQARNTTAGRPTPMPVQAVGRPMPVPMPVPQPRMADRSIPMPVPQPQPVPAAMKKGGKVRGCGVAKKGHGKGKMR